MGTVNYADGIAILQLIIFPFILAASLFIWKRTGWRVGAKIWRYPFTLSLIRLAGSIATLISIDHDSKQVRIAMFVCQLIGIAPLLLAYVGMLRLIDLEKKIPRRPLLLVTLMALVGLILGIVGVSTADTTNGYTPGTLPKAAMGLFLAVYAIVILLTVWLFYIYSFSLRKYQKMLFLGIALSAPFLLVRLIYAALGDYSSNTTFSMMSLAENNHTSLTAYLCMAVLEEIISMVIAMFFGVLAVLQADYVKPTPEVHQEMKYENV
ncbi:hypothetical protein BDV38DRAFT_225717 [Aspergillus pseudotamarii]|uniref:DUF7702 domain-containing protein n=1 Tax=Aspergillus pseudotamarii TaxID=132259 RepID=A0A5N6SBS3_ASPPS|nr:uncharacterized protein BDV38DRAFT_225717 [Aspergillus pseudotamarii]KAE8132055.1 hypothetical protein BDV38DRAFT_225717 [Aspergillus pseudotamarii]